MNETTHSNKTGANDLDALALFGSEEPARTETPAVDRAPYRPSEDPVRSLRTRLASDSRSDGSHLVVERPAALKLTVGEYASTARALLEPRFREYLVRHPKLPAQAGLIACILFAAVIVGHYVGRVDEVPPQPSSPARVPSEPLQGASPATPAPVPPPAIEPQPAADRATDARIAPLPPAPKPQPPNVQRSTIDIDKSNSRSRRAEIPRPREIGRDTSNAPRTAATATVTAPPPPISAVAPVVPANVRPTAVPSAPASPVQAAGNYADSENAGHIYSAEDVDVRPPQMLEAEVPRPSVTNWPTIKNSMELIVTENGTVERVKWLTSRERMPDVMLLSRAKLWKFSPALRDGRPVRYRLIVTWEVNP